MSAADWANPISHGVARMASEVLSAINACRLTDDCYAIFVFDEEHFMLPASHSAVPEFTRYLSNYVTSDVLAHNARVPFSSFLKTGAK